ncbi:MAG: peptidoglycan DD-metalloendopeptidase family protein [Anaerolineae bacterium]|nr:peptidoglycan DD-metalloendopeptidase family protein [Anaerolineae bacterium]
METPYDGKIAVWHWQGRAVSERTIDEVIATLKGWAPKVTAVFAKTSDGTMWQGEYWDADNKPDLAITGPDSIARWVTKLEANGLEFHAWCVPKGRTDTLEQEARLIIQACQVSGVKSMILDIEPYEYFWSGPKENIRKLMEMIRREVPGRFHIAMSMDPRPQHKASIYPEEWEPFVDSIHPQTYWRTFQRPVDEVMHEAYQTWQGFGSLVGRTIPIVPSLQGTGVPDDITAAARIAVQDYGSRGLSYWRFGVIGPSQYPTINESLDVEAPVPPNGDTGIGVTIMVKPEDAAFADGIHSNRPEDEAWLVFRGKYGWLVKYSDTEPLRSEVWARWDPRLPEPGRYEVSVFVPRIHATTQRARYKLHGVVGVPGEKLIEVNQNQYYDQWVSLGVFEFDPIANPASGVIFLNDLTGESGKQIAFDAIRWRQIVGEGGGEFVADGYDPPIGTAAERASAQVWPGHWIDATGFAVRYRIGTPGEAYHTGVDMNLNDPYWDADAHSPVCAAASGEVTFAGNISGWGNVIIIRHDPLASTGQVIYGRYSHVENIQIQKGMRVQRGEQIASVGNAEGLYPYHLHFDLSPTDILESQPGHWPRLDLEALRAHYVDPRAFILNNRPQR